MIPLAYEHDIVWLHPAAKQLAFVREGIGVISDDKRHICSPPDAVIVAHAAITPAPGRQECRIWFLWSDHVDGLSLAKAEPVSARNYPQTLVDPMQIRPNEITPPPSRKKATWQARAWMLERHATHLREVAQAKGKDALAKVCRYQSRMRLWRWRVIYGALACLSAAWLFIRRFRRAS
jgi:hypothetical protein